jgi:hypothetical protein
MIIERWRLMQNVCGDWQPTEHTVGTATCQTRVAAEIHFRSLDILPNRNEARIRAALETVSIDFAAVVASCATHIGAPADAGAAKGGRK